MEICLRSARERNDSPFASVTQLSRNALPAPQFVDASRSVIAKHPRAYWREVQAAGVLRDQSGFYLVTRREDVVAALRDYATFASRRKPPTTSGPATSLPSPVPLAYDPPEHSRFRRILQPYFSPQAANELLPACGSKASALINAVAPNGACEAISEIANPFPFGVLTTLCGLPFADREKLAAWAEAVNWMMPVSPPAFELRAYLVEAIVSDKRPALAAQLLSGDDPLTEEEAIGFMPTLFCPGRHPGSHRVGALSPWPATSSFGPCFATTPIRSGDSLSNSCDSRRPFRSSDASPRKK